MGLDQDRLMLARAELSQQLEALELTSFDAAPVQFLMRLETIRKTAQFNRFDAVAEIASAFEAAMQRAIHHGGAGDIIDSFSAIMEDAIGCRELNPGAASAMLANVALRLGG